MRRRLILIGALSLLARAAFASPYAGEFLQTGIGARPLGMGGAYVALVDDASASYWNPAALPRANGRGIVYMHAETFGSLVNYDTGALVLRSREAANGAKSAVGVSLLVTSVPNIFFTTTNRDERRQVEQKISGPGDPNDPTWGDGVLDPDERINFDALREFGRMVTDRETGLLLSYGRTRAFDERLSLGGSVKFVRKSVDTYSAWGLGLDVAGLWQLKPNWTLGMNLQDATTTFLDWSNTPTNPREYITPTLKIGTAYTRALPSIGGTLTGATDFDVRFEDTAGSSFNPGHLPTDVRAGLEYWYHDAFALRAGSERLGASDHGYTAGAGLRIHRFNATFVFDYAYRNHADLDDTHRVSGGVSF